MEEVTAAVSRPFDFINRTDPKRLFSLIQAEHPQTIALVLVYLEPDKASVVMESLPRETQTEVARRVAIMDRTNSEILRELERALEKKLSALPNDDYPAAGGMESIAEILNRIDRTSGKKIIEALDDDDPDLAEKIRKCMPTLKEPDETLTEHTGAFILVGRPKSGFTFTDVISRMDIAAILKHIEYPVLVTALKLSPLWMFKKLSKSMPFFKRCKFWWDTRLRSVLFEDVDNAREQIISASSGSLEKIATENYDD